MLSKLSYKLSVAKTILIILLTALLLAGVQLSAQAATVTLNPLGDYIKPDKGEDFCATLALGGYDRNKCSAVRDTQLTNNIYLYQRVEWIDVTSRLMTNDEKTVYVSAATLSVNILDPSVKHLQRVLGEENTELLPHATFNKPKSRKDRILLLGVYDRINGALRIVGHRIIYGQLATYNAGLTLSVSNFEVHTQRTTIGPKHFDYLKSTNAWLKPGTSKSNPGINPFERFWEDDASKVFYNINFGAAVVAMSKARALVDADVAYMMVVNYRGTQNDLNINNVGNAVLVDAGFQGVRTEIELYYEWFRLFNHKKELGNLLGQSFSSAYCVGTATYCPDYEIVSSDDSVLYLDYFSGAGGLSEPHRFPPIDNTKATQITPKNPLNEGIVNYIFGISLTVGHDYITSGNPLSPDEHFLTATVGGLGLDEEDVNKINKASGYDGYFINSRWLTYDFDDDEWDKRAATRADFQTWLGGTVKMNRGYAFTTTASYDPMSAASTDAKFQEIGESLYTLFIKQDDLEKSDVAALQCFATADDPDNSNNKSWYEKGCGQVGKSDFFQNKATATQNVNRYLKRSQTIRSTLDYHREQARDGKKTKLPSKSTWSPTKALVELRAGKTINLTGGGTVSKSGSTITANIGGKSYVITERQALKLFHRYPPTNT